MIRGEPFLQADEESNTRLDSKYQLLFATEKTYQFLRLYLLLCLLLSDCREHCFAVPPSDDPSDSYITQLQKSSKKRKRRKTRKLTYSAMLVNLKRVIVHDMTSRDFESFTRKVSKAKVYVMAALPSLIERCVDALVKVAEEDTLLHLYDYCQSKKGGIDPVVVRNHCLAIVPDAYFRIQFNSSEGDMSFCYIASGPMMMSAARSTKRDDGGYDDHEDEDMEDVNNHTIHKNSMSNSSATAMTGESGCVDADRREGDRKRARH